MRRYVLLAVVAVALACASGRARAEDPSIQLQSGGCFGSSGLFYKMPGGTLAGLFDPQNYSSASVVADTNDGSCRLWNYTGSSPATITFNTASNAGLYEIYCSFTYPMTLTPGTATLNGSSTLAQVVPPGGCAELQNLGANWAVLVHATQYSYNNSPSTSGGTVTATGGSNLINLTPSGTITGALTVVLGALSDGQLVTLFSTQAISSLTVSAPGSGTIVGTAVTSLTANSSVQYQNSGGPNGSYIRVR